MDITPLPQGFGAEITSFSLQDDRREVDVELLREAFDTHHLLIFRGEGTISPERQIEICGWFGPTGCDTGGDGRAHTMMDNAQAIGRKALPFHSDITYMEFPIEGISLHPLELPRSPTSTTFVSNACGWDALSPALQAELHDAKGQHYYADSMLMDMDWPVFEYWHPVRMEHPRTGRPLLFVTEHHVEQISGVSEERSAQLLPILFDTLYAPERRYEHFWQPGDLLVWDNIAIQHARTHEADPSEGKRLLQRVQIGKHGFLEQLEKSPAASGRGGRLMELLLDRPVTPFDPARGLLCNEHFQMGYVTNDMAKAEAYFRQRFGVKEFRPTEGEQPGGGKISVRSAWIGNVMYEIICASGPGMEIYTELVPSGDFSLRLHHFGYLIPDEASWEMLEETIACGGWNVRQRSETPGYVRAMFVEASELGNYLEFVLPAPALLERFRATPVA